MHKKKTKVAHLGYTLFLSEGDPFQRKDGLIVVWALLQVTVHRRELLVKHTLNKR